MSKLISSLEASRRLGISIWTLYKWIHAGRLSSFRMGKKMLFDEEEIEAFIRDHRVEMTAVDKNTI